MMNYYEFKGPRMKKREIGRMLFIIFIFFELFIVVFMQDFSSVSFIVGQVVVIVLLLLVYYMAITLLRNSEDIKSDAYTLRLYDDKIQIISPSKNIIIYGKDIEKMKVWNGVIYFRFKEFKKYADYYELNEKQIATMQKKRSYWVGNNIPAISSDERKMLKQAIEEFKRKNGIE